MATMHKLCNRHFPLGRFILTVSASSLLAQAAITGKTCMNSGRFRPDGLGFILQSPFSMGRGDASSKSGTFRERRRNRGGIASLRALDAGRKDGGDCHVRDATLRWVDRVVVGLNLCPWANSALQTGALSVIVSSAKTEEELMQDVVREMKSLGSLPTEGVNGTTLVVTEHLLGDFIVEYNFFAQLVDDAIDDLGYRGVIQLATFHPHYQFAGNDEDDAENWTNRSPFPTLHLIVSAPIEFAFVWKREQELSAALDGFGDPDKVWQRNERLMRSKGATEMRDMLSSCLRDDEENVS